MADNTSSGGNATMAFIIGGLVVAVGVLAYFIFGGDTSVPSGSAGGDDTSITIDNSAPAGDAAPAQDAAPADSGAAPATGGTTQGN